MPLDSFINFETGILVAPETLSERSLNYKNMLEYNIKIQPGHMVAVIVNLLHDLASNELIEISPMPSWVHLSDEHIRKLVEIIDLTTLPDRENWEISSRASD